VLLLSSMKNKLIFPLLTIAVLLASCSEYNQVVKSDDYGKKLEVANEHYDRGSKPKVKRNGETKANASVVLRSVTLYEQIYQRMPKTGEGELAYFRMGKAYYIAGDYYMAGYYLGMFPQRFPYSVKGEEAMFLSAMCSVKNSPESTLDQNDTELAINDLQQFVDRYPNSNLIDSCNKIIDKMRYKLECKAYEDIKLYAKTENYRAAVSSAMTFLDDYPMSRFKEEIQYVLVKNSYLLSKNSIETKKTQRINETIERYSTFVAEYPESKYRKAVAGYNDEMIEELERLKN